MSTWWLWNRNIRLLDATFSTPNNAQIIFMYMKKTVFFSFILLICINSMKLYRGYAGQRAKYLIWNRYISFIWFRFKINDAFDIRRYDYFVLDFIISMQMDIVFANLKWILIQNLKKRKQTNIAAAEKKIDTNLLWIRYVVVLEIINFMFCQISTWFYGIFSWIWIEVLRFVLILTPWICFNSKHLNELNMKNIRKIKSFTFYVNKWFKMCSFFSYMTKYCFYFIHFIDS